MKAVSRALRAPVVSNRSAGPGHYLITLEAPEVAALSRPGQFCMLRPQPESTDPLLGRPLAVFDADTSRGRVSFLYLPVGRGTRLLARKKPAEEVYLNGPLGRAFTPPGKAAAVGVAGGTGVAGVRFLLATARRAGLPAFLFLGARTARLLLPPEHLSFDGECVLATDDGSLGEKGTVLDALGRRLREGTLPAGARYYVAGPLPMMRQAARLAAGRGLWMEVSLEARMGCGLGACRGCMVPARTPHRLYGFMQRAVCQDGPVFSPEEIDWERLPR